MTAIKELKVDEKSPLFDKTGMLYKEFLLISDKSDILHS